MVPNFAVASKQFQNAVNDSWPTVANVNFTGWGTCAGTPTDTLIVTLQNDQAASTTVGFSSGAVHTSTIGALRGDFLTSLGPHEFGHALGFTHEQYRKDFLDEGPGCGWDDAFVGMNNTLGTPPDRRSIMSSTGYCQQLPTLSFWDRRGVKALYGSRTLFVRDGSLDGDFKADILFATGGNIFAATSTGSTLAPTPNVWVDTGPGPTGPTGNFGTQRNNYYPGDFDGDGLMDLGYVETDNTFHVTISTGMYFFGPGTGNSTWNSSFGTANSDFYYV